MNKLREILDRGLMRICIFLFMFMTIMGTYQIVVRYIFKAPSTISEEVITYSFAWMSMLAAAYIFGKRDHMRMVFFIEKFTKKNQNLLAIFGEVVIFLFSAGILVCGGFGITSLTMTQTTPALGISMGYIYGVIPICGVIVCIYSILNINEFLKELKGGR